MKALVLTEGWKLTGCRQQKGEPERIEKPDPKSGDWMDVEVPGDVNATLLKYGLVKDYKIDANSLDYEWVTGKEWWYRLEFDAPSVGKEKAELILECVDGYADVWCNDAYLGELKNAFHPFRLNVLGALRKKDNVILVRFKSLDQLLGGKRFDGLRTWFRRRAFIRKNFFSFGWDWVHGIPSLGLAGEVRLEVDNTCRLQDFSLRPYTSGRLDCHVEVSEETSGKDYEIHFTLRGHGEHIERRFSREERCRSYITVNVPNPKLWFPNGYGEPNLYEYSIELIVNKKVVDSKAGKIGFREVGIVEKPFAPEEGPGFSFEIQVNGHTAFCKGGCWIPLELWPVLSTREQYEVHIRRAKEAGFTMLRIWGGGVYEKDIFYELCDQYGIMVWQDFMFACTGYPLPLIMDEVIEEANYQIRRLRNHPCIAIWCGMNEDVYSWDMRNAYWIEQAEAAKKGEPWAVDRVRDDPILLTMILRGLISKYGLGVPYTESSPDSKDDEGNQPNSGNCHIHCVNYRKPKSALKFREFFEQVCSFDSEFAIDGPCNMKTLRQFVSPEKLTWPPHKEVVYRMSMGGQYDSVAENSTHYNIIWRVAKELFGRIDGWEDLLKKGQTMQLELIRAEFEGSRTFRPNSGGTLMWMYNDCWPALDWSIIDYYHRLKPAYYSSKRACEPLLPIIFEKQGFMNFYFGNDSLEKGKARLEFGQENLQGEVKWSRKRTIDLPFNSTAKFYSISRKELSLEPDDFLFVKTVVNGARLPVVTYFPNLWKTVPWPEPDAKVRCSKPSEKNGERVLPVTVTTGKYLRLAHVYVKDGRDDVTFSDNYFDLPAGASHTVYISSKKRINPDEIALGHWLDWAYL